jgi:hypothetical protein
MAMDLREAMSQIAEIRQQMARTELFRGYRSVPVAFSGVLAGVAAIAQGVWIPEPMRDVPSYLMLWVGVAAIGLSAAAVEMALRARHDPRWAREHTWLAVEQFLPCVLAGGLTTLVLVRSSESVVWVLPGLWSIFFSLGIFASRRLLPRATIGVAFYYLLAGLASLSLARGESALTPWAMGLSFGGGQLLAALVLYRTLERDHGNA